MGWPDGYTNTGFTPILRYYKSLREKGSKDSLLPHYFLFYAKKPASVRKQVFFHQGYPASLEISLQTGVDAEAVVALVRFGAHGIGEVCREINIGSQAGAHADTGAAQFF